MAATIIRDYDNIIRNTVVNGLTINDFLYNATPSVRDTRWAKTACTINGVPTQYIAKNGLDHRQYEESIGHIVTDPILDTLPTNKSYNYVVIKDNTDDKFKIIFGEAYQNAELGIKHDILANKNPLYFAGEIRVLPEDVYEYNFNSSGIAMPKIIADKYIVAFPADRKGCELFISPGEISGFWGPSDDNTDPVNKCMENIYTKMYKPFMDTLLKNLISPTKRDQAKFVLNFNGLHYYYKKIDVCQTDDELKRINEYAAKSKNDAVCIDLETNIDVISGEGKYIKRVATAPFPVYKCKDTTTPTTPALVIPPAIYIPQPGSPPGSPVNRPLSPTSDPILLKIRGEYQTITKQVDENIKKLNTLSASLKIKKAKKNENFEKNRQERIKIVNDNYPEADRPAGLLQVDRVMEREKNRITDAENKINILNAELKNIFKTNVDIMNEYRKIISDSDKDLAERIQLINDNNLGPVEIEKARTKVDARKKLDIDNYMTRYNATIVSLNSRLKAVSDQINTLQTYINTLQSGGGTYDIYEQKYLKYKNKYLNLKKSMNKYD